MQNLLLKIPYKFKKSYGGMYTPEPQTTQDAPWLDRPSLKKNNELKSRHHNISIGRGWSTKFSTTTTKFSSD